MNEELPSQEKAIATPEELDQAIQQKRQEVATATVDKMGDIVSEIQALEMQEVEASNEIPVENIEPENIVESTTLQEVHTTQGAEQLSSVKERLGIAPEAAVVPNQEGTAEIPPAMNAALMNMFNNIDDYGNPRAAANTSQTVEMVTKADTPVQEALATQFHDLAMQNFASGSMRGMLGVYYSFPPSPFRDKLKEIESARLVAAGFAALQ